MKLQNIQAEMAKENPEFLAEVQGLSQEQLHARICALVQDDAAVDQAKEDDQQLKEFKETVSTASAPYKDAKKAIKNKIKLVLSFLDGR